MTDKKEPTVRVAMMFPESLKAELQELAGHRGLTTWVIDACQERLGRAEGETRVLGPKSETQEARKVAQQLANTLAAAVEDEMPILPGQFQQLTLPDWISREQFPEFLGGGKSEPEPEVEADDYRVTVAPPPPPMKRKVEDAKTVLDPEPDPEWVPPVAAAKDDLFSKIQDKLSDLGLDNAGLKPASEIPVPEKPPVDPEPEPFPEPAPDPVSVDVPRCATCGGVLDKGTCWTCAF